LNGSPPPIIAGAPWWMISRSVAQIATASMRTSTSARPGIGIGLSTRLSWPGSPSTQARICSGSGYAASVLTLVGWLTRVSSLRIVSARPSTRSRNPGGGQTGWQLPDNETTPAPAGDLRRSRGTCVRSCGSRRRGRWITPVALRSDSVDGTSALATGLTSMCDSYQFENAGCEAGCPHGQPPSALPASRCRELPVT
jgi:hypothetical protein